MKTHKCDCDGRSLGLDKCDKCKSMTTETNRREFEERFSHFDLSRNPLNGIYFDYGSEGAWQGWQAARERQWMPIETAPKDGTQILSFAEWEGITVCSWLDCSEVWETTEKMGWAKNYDTVAMSYETFEPTHWMPLPNPPTSEKPLTHTREQYEKLKASGMMWEIFPNFTGNYEEDVLNPPTSEKI